MTVDFSLEMMHMRIQWNNNFKVLKEIKNWLQWKSLSKTKVKYSFSHTEGEIILHKQTFTQKNVKENLPGIRKMTLEGNVNWHKVKLSLFLDDIIYAENPMNFHWVQWNLQENYKNNCIWQGYMMKDNIQKFITIHILATNTKNLKF